MVTYAYLFGILLILNGAAGYFMADADSKSLTAFIPSVIGVLLVLCGVISTVKESARMHAMHVSALVGLIGVLGALGNLVRSLASGNSTTLGLAMTAAMGILSASYVVACVQSFRAAGRARRAEKAASESA
jgi:nitrate/nitrite transporter NarK